VRTCSGGSRGRWVRCVRKYRGLRNLRNQRPRPAPEVACKVDERINAEASPYDSHPPPGERIALVRQLNAPGRDEPADEAPAWELFCNREEIERSMTDLIRARVSANHGVAIQGIVEPKTGAWDKSFMAWGESRSSLRTRCKNKGQR